MRRSGRDILSDIDHRIEDTRGRVQNLNRKISEANGKIESFRQEQAGSYLKLAELRVDLLDDTDVVGQLSRAEQEAKSFLDQRQKSRDALDKNLTENRSEQNALEQKRADLLEKIDLFAVKVKNAENKVLETLEQDPAYLDILSAIEKTENQIIRVENKIETAQEDYDTKVKPYHTDPLFIYLWDRGFGTSTYRAGALIRTLDQWVAHTADYEPARRNYAMLSGIPEKLETHKTHMEEKAKELETQQTTLEQTVFEKKGVTKLQEEYKTKRSALDEIDQKIEKLEESYKKILQDQDNFSDEKDNLYMRAVETLKTLYAGQSLHNLRRNAASTGTKEDDKIVRRLYWLDEEIDEIEDRITTYQKALRQEGWQLNEIQNVRKTFKHKRYDTRRTTFSDGNMFNILLGQFITGVLTNAHFWSAVGRLCLEVLDEFDVDIDIGKRRRRHYRPRHRSTRHRSSGGFRTGGGF